MLIRIATKTAISIVRATQREAAKIVRVCQRAGYSVEVSPDWRSGDALKQCAEGYDLAARTEAGAYIPEDERNAAQRERAQRDPVTLEQVEAAFNRLLA